MLAPARTEPLVRRVAVHDAYARLTPYELLLPQPGFPGRRFPAIGDEARERGVDTGNPAAFVMLGTVQGVLAELRDEEAAPESAHDHGGVLYFAYQLWRTGGALVLVRRKTLHSLVSGDREPADPGRNSRLRNAAGGDSPGPFPPDRTSWANQLRGRAGYVQLPQHLVWIEEAGSGPPESVDGFFWFGDAGGALHLALVAGMRSDRPGFAFVPVPPQPLGTLPDWASGPAREGGRDFGTSLPGAEHDGLLGVRTPAEVFKLAALIFGRLMWERPGAPPPEGQPRPAGSREGRPSAAGHAPSGLPYATL